MQAENLRESVRNLTNAVYKDIIFGSRKRYESFLKLMEDYREGYMRQEQYNSVAGAVDLLANEMFYALRKSPLYHKLLLNNLIIKKYREKLEHHPVAGPYYRMSAAYPTSK